MLLGPHARFRLLVIRDSGVIARVTGLDRPHSLRRRKIRLVVGPLLRSSVTHVYVHAIYRRLFVQVSHLLTVGTATGASSTSRAASRTRTQESIGEPGHPDSSLSLGRNEYSHEHSTQHNYDDSDEDVFVVGRRVRIFGTLWSDLAAYLLDGKVSRQRVLRGCRREILGSLVSRRETHGALGDGTLSVVYLKICLHPALSLSVYRRRASEEISLHSGITFALPRINHLVPELVLLDTESSAEFVTNVPKKGDDVRLEGLHVQPNDDGYDTLGEGRRFTLTVHTVPVTFLVVASVVAETVSIVLSAVSVVYRIARR